MRLKPFAIETCASAAGAAVRELRVTGSLDAHAVDAFEQAITALRDQPRCKCILDLGELGYISSAGIGALALFLQQLRRQGGDLVLLRPTPKVLKVLDLLGFTRIFTIVQDREDALRSLGD